MTDKRSSPVKAIIGTDKVVGLMTEDGLNVPGFDGTGYVTDEELEERLEPASLSDLKAGISTKKPIVPLHQHQSVFYALAKAAGANLASSTEETAPDGTNPGVYPNNAKTAIKNLIGAIGDDYYNFENGTGDDAIQQKITDPTKANNASGVKSAAFGSQCVAPGRDAFAEGSSNLASGNYSHAEGFENSATQPAAHAEGQRTKSQGVASHAEGQNTTAHGQGAHAEGIEAWANANAAHAEGIQTIASANYSHAEGDRAVASGQSAHAEGYQSEASGFGAHAESRSVASGNYSHAEGDGTFASAIYSHAEGDRTVASGQSAHAEGYQSTASGYAAHAEGKTEASGNYSHAGGWGSTAIQDCCFAHGREVQARSARSVAFGSGTITSTDDQMVVGRFNSNMLIGSLFVVGNGTSDSQRSNAFEVLASGSIKIGNTILSEAQLRALLALLN